MHDLVQNILRKNKKLSKVGQDRKTFMSAFAHFWSTSAKKYFM